jgi:hypothetical protein
MMALKSTAGWPGAMVVVCSGSRRGQLPVRAGINRSRSASNWRPVGNEGASKGTEYKAELSMTILRFAMWSVAGG